MEAIFQQLEMHMTFICPECGDTFELQQQWRQHLNFHHDYLCKTPEDFGFVEINDRYHECLECNQLVADGKRAIALLQYHRFVHLPYKCTYRCRHCLSTFMRKRICFNHLCRVHEIIVGDKLAAAAMKTPMLANRKENLGKFPMSSNNTTSIARNNPEFYLRCICPQCGFELTRVEDWLNHIETAHRQSLQPDNALQQIAGTEDFLCTICDKILYTGDREKHQRHYFMHLPHKLNFRCAYCKIKRPFKTEIMHHFMTTHLLVFQRQRIFMRKTKEFGHDVNRKLDKELEVFLKYGNAVGAPKGNAWPKLSTSASASTSNRQRSFAPAARKTPAEKNGMIQTAVVSNSTKLTAEPRETNNRTSNIKKELDALCAEIFKDIDGDEIVVENVIEPTNEELLTNSDNLMHCSMEPLVVAADNNLKTVDEEVVSIEIDTLDENELNQINENESDETVQLLKDALVTESVSTTELYDNLKELYNSKVLHLCPQCGISFAVQSIWRDHVLKTHENLNKSVEQNYRLLDDQSHLCLSCNNILHANTTRTELQRHRFTHMPYSAYLKCTLCEKCEFSKTQMLEHLENQHGDYLKSLKVERCETKPPSVVCQTKDSEILKSKKFKSGALIPKVDTSLAVYSENSDYAALLNHLKNARERLNRMAAEYGIENK